MTFYDNMQHMQRMQQRIYKKFNRYGQKLHFYKTSFNSGDNTKNHWFAKGVGLLLTHHTLLIRNTLIQSVKSRLKVAALDTSGKLLSLQQGDEVKLDNQERRSIEEIISVSPAGTLLFYDIKLS